MTTTTLQTLGHNGVKYGALVLAAPTAIHAVMVLFSLHLTPDQVGALDTLLGLAAAAVMMATGQETAGTDPSAIVSAVQAAAHNGAAAGIATALAPAAQTEAGPPALHPALEASPPGPGAKPAGQGAPDANPPHS